MDLLTRRIRGALGVAGPLLFLEGVPRARLGELVRIRGEPPAPGRAPEERTGQVIALSRERIAVQVLEETRGIAPARVEVTLSGQVARLGVARAMLGRVLDGLGRPADGLPPPLPEARPPVHGAALNVTRREKPSDFIETGVSAIDGLNTLVRGQKLPVFPARGSPPHAWPPRSSARRGCGPARARRSRWSSRPWARRSASTTPSSRPSVRPACSTGRWSS